MWLALIWSQGEGPRNISTLIPHASSSNFHSCPRQFSVTARADGTGRRAPVDESFGGCGWGGGARARRNIGGQRIATPLQRRRPSTAWQRSRKTPRGQTHFRNHHGKISLAVCADKRGTGCITKLPRIPIIETTQWHPGQFSAPLLKWSPIQFYVGHL